jgi:hypothetical protein
MTIGTSEKLASKAILKIKPLVKFEIGECNN